MNTLQQIWALLATVTDPEVPVLTILDLGIVRNVEIVEDNPIITITPTYTGCPAMDVISMQIRIALAEKGIKDVQIKNVLAPAWTTDWLTELGKQKLKSYGVAPPQYTHGDEEPVVQCPQCLSYNTRLVSQFGSTACKALYQCSDCMEPFDYFKCH